MTFWHQLLSFPEAHFPTSSLLHNSNVQLFCRAPFAEVQLGHRAENTQRKDRCFRSDIQVKRDEQVVETRQLYIPSLSSSYVQVQSHSRRLCCAQCSLSTPTHEANNLCEIKAPGSSKCVTKSRESAYKAVSTPATEDQAKAEKL